jgi:hypothetical protein
MSDQSVKTIVDSLIEDIEIVTAPFRGDERELHTEASMLPDGTLFIGLWFKPIMEQEL